MSLEIKTYEKDHASNCVEFYLYENPTKEQYLRFKEKHIVKINNAIHVSDEDKLLEL